MEKYTNPYVQVGITIAIAIVFVFSLRTTSYAQGSGPKVSIFPEENITVFTDRDTYFAGDIIWLSAYYFLNEKSEVQEFSKILLIELLDGKEVFAQSKIKIENGRAFGAVRIPEGLLSKNYQLRVYTNWQRNLPPEYYYTLELTILNPTSPLPNPLFTHQVNTRKTDRKPGKPLEIQELKDEYAPREKVQFSITSPRPLTDATVAVIKKGTSGERHPIHSEGLPEGGINQNSIPPQLPDIRDISLSGILVDSASGQAKSGELVYVSIVDKIQQQLHIYRSGKNGEFIFPLNHLSGQQKVFISAKPSGTVPNKILVNTDFSNQYATFADLPSAPDSTQRKLLEELFINYQLQKKYTSVKTDSSSFPQQIPSYFGQPAESITLSDFIKLPSMEDVFTEIIPLVAVRKKKKHFRLWVLNKEETEFEQDPLVLIDNLPVFDIDALMQINPDLVYQIDVINDPYILGSHSIASVILLKTTTTDFAGMKFPESTVFLNYKTREVPLEFPKMEYDIPGSPESRIPDFRTVLYWNPHFIISPSAKEISFYASDHESAYSILIRGFDGEGNYVSLEEEFRVKRR